MSSIIHLKSISEINSFINVDTRHPLVSVVDFSKGYENLPTGTRISADFYSLMFKNHCANHIKYGRQSLDFQDGSLICIAPKQVIEMNDETSEKTDPAGWGLFFHPDLLRGTALGETIDNYTFFSYETNEALHLSDKEKHILADCIHKIESELQENIDHHSQTLIVSNIELLLNYCLRYYGRQFITRKANNTSVVGQIERILKAYFTSENIKENGLPSVKYLAEQVHLSPNYLSDLLKKETGMNTQDHIHYYLIEEAKNILTQTNQSASEIAFALGFEYPQYFSKLFKQKTGFTPLQYRNSN